MDLDIALLGLVFGIANGLLAAGLVLVYKSSRVINFAQGEFGAFTVAMMLALTRNAELNYWLALAVSLAATAALAAVVERGIVQRLFNSPRLVLLIATLGVAQLIIVLRLVLPKPQADRGGDVFFGSGGLFPVPFDGPTATVGDVVLRPEHFMVLIAGPVIIAALLAFLRFTSYGVALRAAAENAPRARLLGIPVRRVSLVAWVVAGLVSGAAAVLLAPLVGFTADQAVGLPLLLVGLAAAAVARMESVAVAFVAGVALGVTDQLVLFHTGESGLTELILFGVIVVALLVRRPTRQRAGAVEESSWDVAEPIRPVPTEVARDPRWRLLVVAATVVVVATTLVAPFVMTASATFFVATVFLIAVVAVSLTMLTGWAGQLSLGQWALAGIGGVFGARLFTTWGMSFWVAFGLAALMGGAVAFAIGIPALRLEGPGLAVVTLGFAIAATAWLFTQEWFQGESFLQAPRYLSLRWYYFVAASLLLLSVTVARLMQRSRVGRNMLAVRDNPAQAAAFGVRVVRTKLAAFVISGIFAAAAGYLWVFGIGSSEAATFDPVRSLTLMTAVVIGGLGSIAGAIIGAFYLLGFPYFGATLSDHIGLLSTGIGVLVLLLFLPGGLVRPLVWARDAVARLVARRAFTEASSAASTPDHDATDDAESVPTTTSA